MIRFRSGSKSIIIDWRASLQISHEARVTEKHLLSAEGLDLIVFAARSRLHFQEFVGFQEDKIDLLQDFEVNIDQAFLASFTFLESDQIAGGDRVNDELEHFTDVSGIAVHSRRVGHFETVRIV